MGQDGVSNAHVRVLVRNNRRRANDVHLVAHGHRMSIVDFSAKKAEKIIDLAKKGCPVNFSKDVLYPSRSGDDMEVVICNGTAI